jgi:hypothetical protein
LAEWHWVLTDGNGSGLAELTTAAGKKIDYKRSGLPEASCTISLEDEAASLLWDCLLNTSLPRLKAYRDGTLRFRGYLAPFQEELEEAATMSLVFRGPFGRLLGDGDGGGRFTAESLDEIADAGQIAKDLIDAANADRTTRIATTGTIETTKLRERTYEYANVGDEIVNLSSATMLDGYDFEVTPSDGSTTEGIFNVYAQQGSDQPNAVFEYGEATLANVQQVTRSVLPPVNAVRVLGAEGDVAEVTDAGSISKYGKWWRQESSSDVADFAVLQDQAYGFLRPDPIRILDFTPDPALAPLPWDAYWLGDTVPFRGRRGAFNEDVSVRVNGISVAIDENGNEAFEIPDPTTPGEEQVIRAGLTVEVV